MNPASLTTSMGYFYEDLTRALTKYLSAYGLPIIYNKLHDNTVVRVRGGKYDRAMKCMIYNFLAINCCQF